MDSSTTELSISGISVAAGETREIYLKVSESYLASSTVIPVTVIRGRKPGPTIFVTAAVHGDEINGADIVRRLIFDIDHEKLSGTLIAIPVVNIPGFHSQSRYLPYNRDLNRFFPGKKTGNNAQRFAHRLFTQVICKCDFGIDLHTAARGRWNLPQIRGDMSNPRVRNLARAFGASIVIDHKGIRGSLRRAATEAGVPTILFEAGEVSKFSRKVSEYGLRGVLDVLAAHGMWHERKRKAPKFKIIIKSSEWVRSSKGGILDLMVKPGELVYKNDVIASVLNPFGETVTRILAPLTGIVIGVTIAPLAVPGTAVVHIARLKKTLSTVERKIRGGKKERTKLLKSAHAKRAQLKRTKMKRSRVKSL